MVNLGLISALLVYESRRLVDVEETSYPSSWRTGYIRGPSEGWRVKSGATLEVGAELEGPLIGDMPTAMIKINYRNNAHLLKHSMQPNRQSMKL